MGSEVSLRRRGGRMKDRLEEHWLVELVIVVFLAVTQHKKIRRDHILGLGLLGVVAGRVGEVLRMLLMIRIRIKYEFESSPFTADGLEMKSQPSWRCEHMHTSQAS